MSKQLIDEYLRPITITGKAAENLLRSLAEDDERIEREMAASRELHKNDPPMTEKRKQKLMEQVIKEAREKDIDYVRKERDNLRHRLALCKRDNRIDKVRLKNDLAKAKQFHLTDSDLWDMDDALAELILPNLIRFKKVNIHSYPHMYEEDLHGLDHAEAWKQTLDDMIYSMQEAVNGYDHEPFKDSAEVKAYGEKVQKGFELFGKYFCHLWD